MALTQAARPRRAGRGHHRRARAARPPCWRPTSPSPAPATRSPARCPANDPEAAGALLDGLGWTAGSDGVRTKDGQPLALTFLYQNNLGRRGRRRRRARGASSGRRSASTATAKAQNETALTGTIFSARRLGRRLGLAQREQPRPAGAVPLRPGRRRTAPTSRRSPTRRTTTAVQAAAATERHRGLRRLAGGRVRADRERRHRAVRQQPGRATFGKGAEFAVPGQLVPLSIRMTEVADGHSLRARSQRPGGTPAAPRSHQRAWVRFAVRRAGPAAGLAVGAGHRVVRDDPPDPRRPGPRRARPDRAGRPGRRPA